MWDLISNPIWGHMALLHMGLTCLAYRRTIAQFLDDCSDGNVERLEREHRQRAVAAARARPLLFMMQSHRVW
jgi:hypothetical protein